MSDLTSDIRESSDAPEPSETPDPSPLAEAEDADPSTATLAPPRRGRPLSVNAVSLILLVVGGAIEGYAVALSMGDDLERQYSLVWALLGATSTLR